LRRRSSRKRWPTCWPTCWEKVVHSTNCPSGRPKVGGRPSQAVQW
jgi:hypothetical protein